MFMTIFHPSIEEASKNRLDLYEPIPNIVIIELPENVRSSEINIVSMTDSGDEIQYNRDVYYIIINSSELKADHNNHIINLVLNDINENIITLYFSYRIYSDADKPYNYMNVSST